MCCMKEISILSELIETKFYASEINICKAKSNTSTKVTLLISTTHVQEKKSKFKCLLVKCFVEKSHRTVSSCCPPLLSYIPSNMILCPEFLAGRFSSRKCSCFPPAGLSSKLPVGQRLLFVRESS